jgi:uncharacterized membrane protein YqjE
MAKRGKRLNYFLYFSLLALLLTFLFLSAFKITPMETGFFTRYIIALIFVLMILPMVPKVKIFSVVDIKRDRKILSLKKKKR